MYCWIVFWSRPSAETLLWGDLQMPSKDSATGPLPWAVLTTWLGTRWTSLASLVLFHWSLSQQLLLSWEEFISLMYKINQVTYIFAFSCVCVPLLGHVLYLFGLCLQLVWTRVQRRSVCLSSYTHSLGIKQGMLGWMSLFICLWVVFAPRSSFCCSSWTVLSYIFILS